MALAPGEQEEEGGPLVFQRGKKLNDEFYIFSVRDDPETAYVKFSAYELESSETFELPFSYADFDALFKTHAELADPANKEGRYDWVIDRLDFATEAGAGLAGRKLTLASEPTVEEEAPAVKEEAGTATKARLTYAERVRLRHEAEQLEEKRAQNIALKSERNRKALVAELQAKKKLEELKVQSRQQRIDEERAERRERAEMQRHLEEERRKRYNENDHKRESRIATLEAERKARDLAQIMDIIQTAKQGKEAMRRRIEDARARKEEDDKVYSEEMAAQEEERKRVEQQRLQRIAERDERLRQSEKEYLQHRAEMIEKIAREKLEKEDAKQAYLRERATQRASQLREKHERIEAWETLEDIRTQANMTKDHDRNMLMLDHIEALRNQFQHKQQEAAARKQASVEQRKQSEAQAAAQKEAEKARKAEIERKRQEKIAIREKGLEEKNQEYCRHIRDLKTQESIKTRDQQESIEFAMEQAHEAKMQERQDKREQDQAAETIQAIRDENIRKRDEERDKRFAKELQDEKDKEQAKKVEAQARKLQRRQMDMENSTKVQEDENQKRRQMKILEEQREAMMRERAAERNKREQERHKSAAAEK